MEGRLLSLSCHSCPMAVSMSTSGKTERHWLSRKRVRARTRSVHAEWQCHKPAIVLIMTCPTGESRWQTTNRHVSSGSHGDGVPGKAETGTQRSGS